LHCEPWERWPAVDELADILRQECDEVRAVPVAYDEFPADGRIIAWCGRKRAPGTMPDGET
jgi:hypothetical protein